MGPARTVGRATPVHVCDWKQKLAHFHFTSDAAHRRVKRSLSHTHNSPRDRFAVRVVSRAPRASPQRWTLAIASARDGDSQSGRL